MVGTAVPAVELPPVDTSETVAAFAIREKLFRRVSNVVVAVSGGPDSLAALLILLRIKDDFGFAVTAAHFNHMLRPTSADDLAYVRTICSDLGVKCMTGEGDVSDAAARSGDGVEATARKARYEFLAFAAGRERAEAVVTGHTHDDQAETVLQRVVRGTGVRGLRGMLPVSPLPGSDALQLVRPLLSIRREQTVEICEAAAIKPLVDPSNADVTIQRNKVRLETLPALRALNPSVDEALVRLGQNARESFAPIEQSANLTQPLSRSPEGSVFSLDAFQTLTGEGRTLVVEREASFHKTAVLVNHTVLENLDDVLQSGAGMVAFGETEVEASCGLIRIGGPRPASLDVPETVLTIPGAVVAGGFRIVVATEPIPAQEGALTGVVSMKASSASLLRVRRLQPGDRLKRPDGERKVSALFADAKVASWDRGKVLAIATKDVVLALIGAPEGVSPVIDEEDALYVQALRIEAK